MVTFILPTIATMQSEVDFLRTLEAGRIPPDGFGHRNHIRAAWAYVRQYDLLQATARMRRTLQGLANAHGTPQKYHETVTCAYVLLVHERLARDPDPDDWNGFADRHPELFEWNPGLMEKIYGPDVLRSAEAKRQFLLPSVAAVPTAESTGTAT